MSALVTPTLARSIGASIGDRFELFPTTATIKAPAPNWSAIEGDVPSALFSAGPIGVFNTLVSGTEVVALNGPTFVLTGPRSAFREWSSQINDPSWISTLEWTTTLVNVALSEPLNVVVSEFDQRTLRFSGVVDSPNVEPAIHPRRREALHAIEELMDWLDMSLDDVARLCGVSPRALLYWRRRTTPHASTVRHLFEVHSLVRSLVGRVGLLEAREWLGQRSQGAETRLELLGRQDAMSLVLREASPLLFSEQARPRFAADDFLVEEPGPPASDSPPWRGEPRRVRKAPRYEG